MRLRGLCQKCSRVSSGDGSGSRRTEHLDIANKLNNAFCS
jgi:hypothetical protein